MEWSREGRGDERGTRAEGPQGGGTAEIGGRREAGPEHRSAGGGLEQQRLRAAKELYTLYFIKAPSSKGALYFMLYKGSEQQRCFILYAL